MTAPAATAKIKVVDTEASTVALLCDHLDAVLGHGEALCALSFEVTARVADGDKMRALLKQNRMLGEMVAEARGLELALLLRLTRAAQLARSLGREGSHLAKVVRVFGVSVAPAIDAARRIEATRSEDADAPLAWLRRRALLADGVAGLADLDAVTIDDRMRIGGAVTLGVILDAVAAALDAIEAATLRRVDQTGAGLR